MAGVTNQAVGDRLGLSLSAVSRLRHGKRSPSLQTIMRLHQEFDLPVEPMVRAAADPDKTAWCALLGPIFVPDEPEAA